jgi:hypothetical protein
MQKVIVRFPESRPVFSSGIPVGDTNTGLIVEDGTHVFTLGDPQDYAPASQEIDVQGTSASRPMIVTFVSLRAVVGQWLSPELAEVSALAPTLDAALAHFAPISLAWTIERDPVAGKARATAVLECDAVTGGTWLLGVLERSGFDRHRHKAGGDYGEMIVTLAGELSDVDDGGRDIRIGAASVAFHGGNTVHAPAADAFWLGFFHQPRGLAAL